MRLRSLPASFALTCLIACSRSGGPEPLPRARIDEVVLVGDGLRAGRRGVLFELVLTNIGEIPVEIVDAGFASSPEGAVTGAAIGAPFPALAEGHSARLAFAGEVDSWLEPGTVSILPRVTVADPEFLVITEAERASPEWSFVVSPRAPALVVNTTLDEDDVPVGAIDVASAGPALSLREALELIDNGADVRRVEFEGTVFYPGSGASIVVGRGPGPAVRLPELRTPGVEIDGRGRDVRVEHDAAMPAVAEAALVISAPDVRVSGITLRVLRAVSCAGGERLGLRELEIDSYAPLENNGVIVLSGCDDSEISDLTVRDGDGAIIVVTSSPRVVLRRLELQRTTIEVEGGAGLALEDAAFNYLGPYRPSMVRVMNADGARLERLSFLNKGGYNAVRASGDDLLIRDITATRCLDRCEEPLVLIETGARARIGNVSMTDWFGSRVFDFGAAYSGPSAVIEVAEPGLVRGTSDAADGSVVALYFATPNSAAPAAEGVVRAGEWEIALQETDSRWLRAAVTDVVEGTGRLTELRRTRAPSLCPPGRSLFHNSFEPRHAAAWWFGNAGLGFDYYAPDELHYATTSSTVTPSFLELLDPIDLSLAVRPELRFLAYKGACCSFNPEAVQVETRLGVDGTWIPSSITEPTTVWAQRTHDLTSLAGQTSVYLRFSLTSAGINNVRLDQVEICELDGL